MVATTMVDRNRLSKRTRRQTRAGVRPKYGSQHIHAGCIFIRGPACVVDIWLRSFRPVFRIAKNSASPDGKMPARIASTRSPCSIWYLFTKYSVTGTSSPDAAWITPPRNFRSKVSTNTPCSDFDSVFWGSGSGRGWPASAPKSAAVPSGTLCCRRRYAGHGRVSCTATTRPTAPGTATALLHTSPPTGQSCKPGDTAGPPGPTPVTSS